MRNITAGVVLILLMAMAQVVGAGVLVVLGGVVRESAVLREDFLVWLVLAIIALACGLSFLAGSIPWALKLLWKIKG